MKYKCEAQVLIEKEFEAEDEDTARIKMIEYLEEEYASLDWCVSAYRVNSIIDKE